MDFVRFLTLGVDFSDQFVRFLTNCSFLFAFSDFCKSKIPPCPPCCFVRFLTKLGFASTSRRCLILFCLGSKIALSDFCKGDFAATDFLSPPFAERFFFAFAWTLQPAWIILRRCEFGLYQISVKVHFYTGYHEIQLDSLSPLPGSHFSFSRPIRNIPYFSLQGRFRRFYPFDIVVSL